MELRCSVPVKVPFVDPRMGEDGMEWHEDGVEVPEWALGIGISMLGVVLLMVVSLLLAAQPTNRPERGGPVPTPSTYGPPVGW